MKRIICTVTNDLVYDQRMIRICSSLSTHGYDVKLVGRKKRHSPPLLKQSFEQIRLHCFFEKGKWFYLEYNVRLFIYLLFSRADLFCSIDLDTILPNLWVSKIRGKKRVYDAHELFCEMEEIVRRPRIYKLWKRIEAYAVPQFHLGYTIGSCYKEEFNRMYNVNYEIVRNACVLVESNQPNVLKQKHIFYQGAVNEGRCFESLIPAMKFVDAPLIICGEGNFMTPAKTLAKEFDLEHKIIFKGYIEPAELKSYTKAAYVGLTLFQEGGKSNLFSLANRFFDYMHFGVPQLCMKYPEYEKINNEFEVACLIETNDADSISKALNTLLNDNNYYNRLKSNCMRAREVYNWQNEEEKLIRFYKKYLG